MGSQMTLITPDRKQAKGAERPLMTCPVRPIVACFIIGAALMFAGTLYADIYKCVSDDGGIIFRDEPCGDTEAVAFEIKEYGFDDVIGNASPYLKQPVAPSTIDEEDFCPHAMKIGKVIVPHLYNNTCENQSKSMSFGWNFNLFFGPESNKRAYEILMSYRRRPTNSGIYVWLDHIVIKKEGKLFDPATMANVKTFKKTGTGRWEIRRD